MRWVREGTGHSWYCEVPSLNADGTMSPYFDSVCRIFRAGEGKTYGWYFEWIRGRAEELARVLDRKPPPAPRKPQFICTGDLDHLCAQLFAEEQVKLRDGTRRLGG